MSDSPFLQRLFQQDPDLPGNFYDHGFLFEFLHVDVVEDIFYYDISYDHEFKMSFVVCGVDTTENCNPSSNLDFVLYMAKLRTFHFCQILSDLCSQRLSNPTRTGMSKTLQSGIRRVERRYTLPRMCHQDSKHITSRDQMSASQRLQLFYLQAAASLPTRFRIPYTLSHCTRTAQVRNHYRDHIRSVYYGATLTKAIRSATAPSKLSPRTPTFPLQLLQEVS